MSKAVGAEIKVAVRKALAWGTAKACGAGHGILMKPGTIKKDRGSMIDDSLGDYWSTDSNPGEIKAAGDINAYLRYDGLDLLLAMCMGTVTTSYTAPVTGTATGGSTSTLIKAAAGWSVNAYQNKFVHILTGTGAGQVRKIASNDATTLTVDVADGNWTAPDNTSTFEISNAYTTHVHDLADSLDGLFVTYCINNNVNIDEYSSVKVTGFTLKGSVGQPVEVSFKVIANDRVTGSVINTTITFATVTIGESANRVLYNQGVIRMNAASAGALASPTDVIYPSGFELTFSRKMSGLYGAGGTFNTIDEPSSDGRPEVKLKLDFPRYTAVTHFTNWDADTAMKLDMTFTGSGSRSALLQFPNIKYASVDLPIEAGIFKHPLEFNCLSASAAPTGMTGVTKPFRLTMVNTYGGDPLQIGN